MGSFVSLNTAVFDINFASQELSTLIYTLQFLLLFLPISLVLGLRIST